MKARGAGNERGGGEKEIEAREKVKEKVRERERDADLSVIYGLI